MTVLGREAVIPCYERKWRFLAVLGHRPIGQADWRKRDYWQPCVLKRSEGTLAARGRHVIRKTARRDFLNYAPRQEENQFYERMRKSNAWERHFPGCARASVQLFFCTSSSNVRAASLPRLLAANGLSPVRSFRSWNVLPSMFLFTISTPIAASFSPKNQRNGPGM